MASLRWEAPFLDRGEFLIGRRFAPRIPAVPWAANLDTRPSDAQYLGIVTQRPERTERSMRIEMEIPAAAAPPNLSPTVGTGGIPPIMLR